MPGRDLAAAVTRTPIPPSANSRHCAALFADQITVKTRKPEAIHARSAVHDTSNYEAAKLPWQIFSCIYIASVVSLVQTDQRECKVRRNAHGTCDVNTCDVRDFAAYITGQVVGVNSRIAKRQRAGSSQASTFH
ncbi:hypothetical protein Bbelb_265050 [Branchiostoma belcheri]|nr:hypothetical protein Bbelb_265050 [Branchiostoma belcheri]